MTDDLSLLLDRAADDALWEAPPVSADLARAREAAADTRRRRTRLLVAGVAAAAVAAAVLVAVGVGVGSGPGGGRTDSNVAGDPDVTILDYRDRHRGAGVQIDDPAEVGRLAGAPDDFTDFIVQALAEADDVCSGFEGANGGVLYVQQVRTGEDGVAVGSVGGCAGYTALWAVVDGRWREVDATQDVRGCGVLRRYDVPASFVDGQCVEYGGDRRLHSYP